MNYFKLIIEIFYIACWLSLSISYYHSYKCRLAVAMIIGMACSSFLTFLLAVSAAANGLIK
jgi:hypothetical protein